MLWCRPCKTLRSKRYIFVPMGRVPIYGHIIYMHCHVNFILCLILGWLQMAGAEHHRQHGRPRASGGGRCQVGESVGREAEGRAEEEDSGEEGKGAEAGGGGR